jgi:L-lactate dehydrogenase complex protein LldE
MEVDIFIPCFVDQIFPQTAWNMVKVLEKAGCKVNYNQEQTCCGQPAWNAGFKERTRPVALKWINDFNTSNPVVSPSGSCVGMIRSYYLEMFANTSNHLKCRSAQQRTFELTEFLTEVIKIEDFGAKLAGKATYHDACGALRECHIKEAPRRLLSHVRGLELVEMNECETCCGFGGTFAVKFEPISVAMAEQKVNNALETGAEYLISTDLSCLMHIDAYIQKKKLPLRAMHIADVLASGWDTI